MAIMSYAREMGSAVMKAISSMSSPSSTPAQLRSKKRATKPSVSPLPVVDTREVSAAWDQCEVSRPVCRGRHVTGLTWCTYGISHRQNSRGQTWLLRRLGLGRCLNSGLLDLDPAGSRSSLPCRLRLCTATNTIRTLLCRSGRSIVSQHQQAYSPWHVLNPPDEVSRSRGGVDRR
jgi:hypothetical protein